VGVVREGRCVEKVSGTYREQSGVEVGSTWLMFGVLLLLSLVLVVVESFNGRPEASIRFNGRECMVLQI
jgi:hypothetical protein